MAIILTGAIPAAAMAIGIQYVFGWFEKWFIPRGLRLEAVD
jgi:osmoprotectant transport system permease protein